MSDRWWEPDTSLEEAKANEPWWAAIDATYVTCPRCGGSGACSQCEHGCLECGFGRHCRLCNGSGSIPNPDLG